MRETGVACGPVQKISRRSVWEKGKVKKSWVEKKSDRMRHQRGVLGYSIPEHPSKKSEKGKSN